MIGFKRFFILDNIQLSVNPLFGRFYFEVELPLSYCLDFRHNPLSQLIFDSGRLFSDYNFFIESIILWHIRIGATI